MDLWIHSRPLNFETEELKQEECEAGGGHRDNWLE